MTDILSIASHVLYLGIVSAVIDDNVVLDPVDRESKKAVDYDALGTRINSTKKSYEEQIGDRWIYVARDKRGNVTSVKDLYLPNCEPYCSLKPNTPLKPTISKPQLSTHIARTTPEPDVLTAKEIRAKECKDRRKAKRKANKQLKYQ